MNKEKEIINIEFYPSEDKQKEFEKITSFIKETGHGIPVEYIDSFKSDYISEFINEGKLEIINSFLTFPKENISSVNKAETIIFSRKYKGIINDDSIIYEKGEEKITLREFFDSEGVGERYDEFIANNKQILDTEQSTKYEIHDIDLDDIKLSKLERKWLNNFDYVEKTNNFFIKLHKDNIQKSARVIKQLNNKAKTVEILNKLEKTIKYYNRRLKFISIAEMCQEQNINIFEHIGITGIEEIKVEVVLDEKIIK